jgi:hypothetical protein
MSLKLPTGATAPKAGARHRITSATIKAGAKGVPVKILGRAYISERSDPTPHPRKGPIKFALDLANKKRVKVTAGETHIASTSGQMFAGGSNAESYFRIEFEFPDDRFEQWDDYAAFVGKRWDDFDFQRLLVCNQSLYLTYVGTPEMGLQAVSYRGTRDPGSSGCNTGGVRYPYDECYVWETIPAKDPALKHPSCKSFTLKKLWDPAKVNLRPLISKK